MLLEHAAGDQEDQHHAAHPSAVEPGVLYSQKALLCLL